MYPAKEISTEMANPVRRGWTRLKKVSRFLKAREKAYWEFPWQDECTELHAYGDVIGEDAGDAVGRLQEV